MNCTFQFFDILYFYFKVGFRRPIHVHANNNLIAIIPTDGEGEPQKNELPTKNSSNCFSSKLSDASNSSSNKPTAVQNENNEGNILILIR